MSKKWICFNFLIIILVCATNANFSRSKRSGKYPKGSAVGCIVALAIPTEDISESVYLAFNFEANFILPNYESSISSYISKDDVRKRSTDAYSSIKNTFTRKNIYAAIESQLFSVGLNGTACILKTICQTNEIPIYESNGVMGSLFHIVFTPSSSENENLPDDVYAAERSGLKNECGIYDADCPKGILDFIGHTIMF